MVNNFGKFCRKLRIDKGELLADMAGKLGVSSAFLSKVENGGKKPPKEWQEKITQLYRLSEKDQAVLDECMFEAINYRGIDMNVYTDDNRMMLLSFARKLNSMDEKKKDQIKKMFL